MCPALSARQAAATVTVELLRVVIIDKTYCAGEV
jgi:hypothetical protein